MESRKEEAVTYVSSSSPPLEPILSYFRSRGLVVRLQKELTIESPPACVVLDISHIEPLMETRLLELSSLTEQLVNSVLLVIGAPPQALHSPILKHFEHVYFLEPTCGEAEIEERLKGSILTKNGKIDSQTGTDLEFIRGLEPQYCGNIFGFSGLSQIFDDAVASEIGLSPVLKDRFLQMSKANPRRAVRAQKVCMLGRYLASEYESSELEIEACGLAGLFLNSSIPSHRSDLFNFDPIVSPQSELLEELTAYFATSEEHFDNTTTGKTARACVRFIGENLTQKVTSSNSEVKAISDCILLTELAERSVFSNEQWNSYKFARLLRKLSTDRVYDIDPYIIDSFGLTAAEALSLRLLVKPEPALMYERATEYDRLLLSDASASAAEEFSAPPLNFTAVKELQDGMKLTRPISTADGILVLRAGTVLTEDLLDRISRLDSVRPLREIAVAA